MKKNILTFCLIFFVGFIFCNSSSFSLTTDVAYYPKSENLPKTSDSWFSPTVGLYSGIEARVVGEYSYKIPTPFGTNPLVSGNNVELIAAIELSPVTFSPIFSVSFTPIAFLNFTASAKVGTGWEIFGISGMGEFVSPQEGFTVSKPFDNFFYEYKFSSLFQFDLGVVIPGDWNHVVMQATYDVIYTGLTNSKTTEPWWWQNGGENFTGWNYYSNIIIGYQMPLILQTVGFQFEFSGYYDSLKLNPNYDKWNKDFCKICINPVAILKFNEKHALTIQTSFASRRGFSAKQGEAATKYDLEYTGREWYFNRIAFSYSINF